ncbi:MAG: hypothetical protein JXR96_06755 [Deltaproteobacteria bacterium]|nr:hypothetical protein [Deltaproteobacteria bacterium]
MRDKRMLRCALALACLLAVPPALAAEGERSASALGAEIERLDGVIRLLRRALESADASDRAEIRWILASRLSDRFAARSLLHDRLSSKPRVHDGLVRGILIPPSARADEREVLRLCECIASEDPRSAYAARALLTLGDQLSASGWRSSEEARARYLAVIERFGKSRAELVARQRLGRMAMRDKSWERARELLEHVAIQTDPVPHRPLLVLGAGREEIRHDAVQTLVWVYASLDDPLRAWEAFRRYGLRDEERVGLLETLASRLYCSGRADKSLEVYRRLLEEGKAEPWRMKRWRESAERIAEDLAAGRPARCRIDFEG